MGRDEVLAEIYFYDAEGACIGRLVQWSHYRDPGCEDVYRTPPGAAYFRVCSAHNYSVNCFDRSTQGYCHKGHGLAAVPAGDRLSALWVEDPADVSASEAGSEPESESESESESASDAAPIPAPP